MKSVNEVSKLSGVSRRTLQYYDEIGLLPPSAVKESGYRQYDDESLRRLWIILFYKELGISLEDIRLMLENSKEMKKKLMRQHKEILLEKQSRLQKMIQSVDCILNDKFEISMLRDFDRNRIETLKKTYASEIRELMESTFFLPIVKSGLLPGKVSLLKNASKIMTLDFGKIITLSAEVMRRFCEAMKYSTDSSEAIEAVTAFRELMQLIIACDDKMFHNIGQAYFDYKKELDQKVPGLAEFVSSAIMHTYP